MADGNNLAHGKGSISTKAIENIRPNVTGSKNYLLIYFYLKLKIERPGKKKKQNPVLLGLMYKSFLRPYRRDFFFLLLVNLIYFYVSSEAALKLHTKITSNKKKVHASR